MKPARKEAGQIPLEFLNDFIRLLDVLVSKENFSLAFDEFTKKIAAAMNAAACKCYLYSEGENVFSPAFAVKTDKAQHLMNFYFSQAIFEEVIASGVPYINNEFEAKVSEGAGRVATIKSMFCFPLIKDKKKIGILELFNKLTADGFGQHDIDFLSQLAKPVASIVDNAVLFQNTELLCYLDDVTKLFNTRYLKQSITNEIKRSLRYRKKVSLLFLDIDRFKLVNDSFGHLVGSETLMEIGGVLRGCVRGTDVVARYGGDEFVIILPETASEKASIIAERIREKIERYRFGMKRNLKISLTVSIGVATCPNHALTSEGLIQKADTAMYEAKSRTKNAIRVAL